MHKIDSPGATVGNLFTEGNPSLGIPATEVSDDWLNDVQEELVTVITGQGIALIKGQQDQLNSALLSMLGGGGTNIKLDPLANNTADQVVTGLIIDKAVHQAVAFFFSVNRQTVTQNEQEVGVVMASYDIADDVWRLSKIISGLDDSGSDFNIVPATGQVRVTTDDLTGATYLGQLRITSVLRFTL